MKNYIHQVGLSTKFHIHKKDQNFTSNIKIFLKKTKIKIRLKVFMYFIQKEIDMDFLNLVIFNYLLDNCLKINQSSK